MTGLLLVCMLLPAPGAAQSIQDVMAGVDFEQKINQPLPLDARFRDETGREVELGAYFARAGGTGPAKPVIVALVYYDCPMLCTFILNGLVKGLKPLKLDPGRDFDVVVISFDPRETPELAAEKKQMYMREYRRPGTAAGWHFLTGDADNIQRVTEAAGFRYLYDEKTGDFAHASGILVATPQGKLFRYFYGIEYAPRDLRLALVEASAGKLGTAVDRVLLYCFHYDPVTGKYGLLIQRVIRLAGTATVLALGLMLFVFLRQERKGRQAPS